MEPGWVSMDHPDTVGIAVVTQEAFDQVWAPRGWVLVEVGGVESYSPYKALARDPDGIISGFITRDANDAVISADVMWPDGVSGTFTATTVSVAFPGAVDAYTVTYGSPVVRTYTQPLLTRNATGAVINRPEMVVT